MPSATSGSGGGAGAAVAVATGRTDDDADDPAGAAKGEALIAFLDYALVDRADPAEEVRQRFLDDLGDSSASLF